MKEFILILLPFLAFSNNIRLNCAYGGLQRDYYSPDYSLNKIHFGRLRGQKQNSNCPIQNSISRDNIKPLNLQYSWKNLEFGFPSENEKQAAIRDNNYQADAVIPIDIDVQYSADGSSRVFTTIPRFGEGVPYSLAVVSKVNKSNGPELQPYPSYKWHSSHGKDCDGLTSVYRIHIDECQRMWVLDSGEINFNQFCSPQIVVFDLATDTLVHRYRLPETIYKEQYSRFVTVLVDVEDPLPAGNCQKVFVYMADATGLGIVVYDVLRNQSWRVENKYTHPDPAFGTHTIAGESFEFMDGTFGFSVTPKSLGTERLLYFHSLSSGYQHAIPLRVINDPTKWTNGIVSSLSDFITFGNRGVQCGPEAMSETGYHLCGHLEPIGIFAWDVKTPYEVNNRCLVAFNPTTLQFVSGLKVKKDPNGKEIVWTMSNRLQKILNSSIDYQETNYRVQTCGVTELLSGNPCN